MPEAIPYWTWVALIINIKIYVYTYYINPHNFKADISR